MYVKWLGEALGVINRKEKKVRYIKNGKVITHLNHLINKFPNEYKDVLWLSLKGLESEDIAIQLSLSEWVVRCHQRTIGLYIRKHFDHVLEISIGLRLYQEA